DGRGGGTASDVVDFKYQSQSGKISILTKERIIVGAGENIDTVINPIGLVELKVEVLDGSLEAPLLFYTDLNGYLERDRPVGTYRITAIKSGFQSQSKTVIVKNGEITSEVFYLERPPATIYGKVIDNDGYGIKSATILAISDRGDTAKCESDASGNFILNCYEDNWVITSSKSGYIPSLPMKVSINYGQNYNIGSIVLKRNPLTLSGKVVNSKGEGILGVKVTLQRNGNLVGEVPSTPQNGEFSFMVEAGSYTIIATKTGFNTYMSSIEIASSKSITITMEGGAATISGYVYGRSWINGIEVIAPITTAEVKFVEEGKTDTITVMSHYTYGDFKVSLAGDKKYLMFSRAEGFVKKENPVIIYTKSRENQKVSDTLRALGYIKGIVKHSVNRNVIGGAEISLIDINTFHIVAKAKSSADGSFEISKIPDGSYIVFAGKQGLVLDSILDKDTIIFSQGKPDRNELQIFLKAGNKTIKWYIKGKNAGQAVVKIISPLVKNIREEDSLIGAGSGTYIVSVDASDNSIVDLSYHRFSVFDEEIVHIDTISIGVIHICKDSIEPQKGKISLSVTADMKMDSAAIFYKDFTASSYKVFKKNNSDSVYTFEFEPPTDARYMLYYFKLWKGSDIYGHDKEVYKTYVKPNMGVVTKLEIIPSSERELSLPSNYNAFFELKAYVSSMFIPLATVDQNAVKWELKNPQGCLLKNSSGTTVNVTSGKTKTSIPCELIATIDTTILKLSSGIKNSISVKFNVSGTEIKSLVVKRIDANAPAPITTSPSDYAEFVAKGYDGEGLEFDIIPEWSVSPVSAGTISKAGIFKPVPTFCGDVRIFASVNNIREEYKIENGKDMGLRVRYIIINKQKYDSATNMKRCAVVFPPEVVGKNEFGVLEIVNIPLSNQIKRGIGTLRTIDTMAFEIKQLENISFDLSKDSIRLVFNVPSNMRERVASGKQKIAVGYWMEDSLKWKPLSNSIVANDGSTVSAAVTHFSKYTLIYEPSNTLSMEIAPNPFSPYIIPPYNPFDDKERIPQYNGTCIKIHADIKEQRAPIQLRIYNITGDLVWSCMIQNADNSPYYIWWDGRTSSKDILPDGVEHVIVKKGEKMCRNGRYFVVLSAKIENKEQKIMKPVVLMK
ncbi:MAG: carboxypeptidase-like regulatory domain-containing protein, partial [Chitinispirillaceae bacterium]|nr:carboxypeptidase-like regulatory domain-containing protein [Chitinispirillaceae bacterium]